MILFAGSTRQSNVAAMADFSIASPGRRLDVIARLVVDVLIATFDAQASQPLC
jgi:hypothetical protein